MDSLPGLIMLDLPFLCLVFSFRLFTLIQHLLLRFVVSVYFRLHLFFTVWLSTRVRLGLAGSIFTPLPQSLVFQVLSCVSALFGTVPRLSDIVCWLHKILESCLLLELAGVWVYQNGTAHVWIVFPLQRRQERHGLKPLHDVCF